MATSSSPEVILALEEATQDENEDVAERAIQALLAEVHHQMAIQMGKNLAIYEPQPRSEIESKPKNPNDPCITVGLSLLLLPVAFILGVIGFFFMTAPTAGSYALNYIGCVLMIAGIAIGLVIVNKGVRAFMKMPP